MAGFPIDMIALVKCTRDGAQLRLSPCHLESAGRPDEVESGRLYCSNCDVTYEIANGVLDLLDRSSMDAESLHELACRDMHGCTTEKLDTELARTNNAMEMIPTMNALSVTKESLVIEFGCGEGRYTVPLACTARVLAVDFSIELLRKLQSRLPSNARVGLVIADIATLKLASSRFDFALSTLTSNLPSFHHRQKLYALARDALNEVGTFVYSTHHRGFRQVLAGEEKSGHYRAGGIYRYQFAVRECLEEIRPFFRRRHARPIQIHVPFARTIGFSSARVSQFLERIPFLNRFGMLVLCVAERPCKGA